MTSIYNLCGKKIRLGKDSYLNEIFDWYQFAIRNNLYLDQNGSIDKVKYKNVISTSLRIGKYEFAENFAYEFAQYLDEDNRDNILTFNLAQVEFYKSEFDNVISLLSQIKYLDVNDNLNSRMITLCSYYELKEFVAFEYYADSFLSYLNRKKELFNEEKRITHRKFINMAKKLYKVQAGSLSKDKLQDELDNSTPFPGKTWINKKLDQIDLKSYSNN